MGRFAIVVMVVCIACGKKDTPAPSGKEHGGALVAHKREGAKKVQKKRARPVFSMPKSFSNVSTLHRLGDLSFLTTYGKRHELMLALDAPEVTREGAVIRVNGEAQVLDLRDQPLKEARALLSTHIGNVSSFYISMEHLCDPEIGAVITEQKWGEIIHLRNHERFISREVACITNVSSPWLFLEFLPGTLTDGDIQALKNVQNIVGLEAPGVPKMETWSSKRISGITGNSLPTLAQWPHLFHLNLSATRLKPHDIEQVVKIKGLRHLNLAWLFEGASPDRWTRSFDQLHRLPSLGSLTLGDNPHLTDLKGVAKCKELRELLVAIPASSPPSLSPITALTRLEMLQITSEYNLNTMEWLSDLKEMKSLRYLRAPQFVAGPSDFRGLSELPRLAHLSVGTVKNIDTLKLTGYPALKVLRIENYSDDSNIDLHAFESLPALKRFHFGARVGDYPAKYDVTGTTKLTSMGGLPAPDLIESNPNLRDVHLLKVNLKPYHYRALGKRKYLKRLWLDRVGLETHEFSMIAKLKGLEVLDLRRAFFYSKYLRGLVGIQKLGLLRVSEKHLDPVALEYLAPINAFKKFHLAEATDYLLERVGKMTALEQLTISAYDTKSVTDKGVLSLAGLVNLRELVISGQLTHESMRVIGRCKKLTRLAVSQTALTGRGLQYLAALPHLRSLSIHSRAKGAFSLEGLRHLKRLKVLKLDGTISLEGEFPHMPGLRELKIGVYGKVQGVQKILAMTPNLRSLKLGGAAVSPLSLPPLKHLKRLSVVGELTARELHALKMTPNLQWISLFATKFTDAHLEALAHLHWLAALDLSNSNVTDRGMVHVSKMRSLRLLDLSNTAVSDTGVALLKACKLLNVLNIKKTKVTSKSLPIMMKFPSLIQLYGGKVFKEADYRTLKTKSTFDSECSGCDYDF